MNLKIRKGPVPNLRRAGGRAESFPEVYTTAKKLKVNQWFEVPLPKDANIRSAAAVIRTGINRHEIPNIQIKTGNGRLLVRRRRANEAKGK